MKPDVPSSATFRVESKPTGECVVSWQYPLPRNFSSMATLLAVIMLVFSGCGISTVLSNSYPLSIFAAVFFAIPIVISIATAIGFALDDRSESLTFWPDRIEHDSVSNLTHSLYISSDQFRYEFANTARYGWIGDFGYLPVGIWFSNNRIFFSNNQRPDVPVLHRSESERLLFLPFGEAPECILLSGNRAMVVGPYLRHREQFVIAKAIEAWMQGRSISEIGEQLKYKIEHLNLEHRHPANENKLEWNKLLEVSPKGFVVQHSDDGQTVTISRMFVTLRFGPDRIAYERRGIRFGRHTTNVNYDAIEQVCETWWGDVIVDYLSDNKQVMNSIRLKVDPWVGSLIAARCGKPFRRSKLVSSKK